MHFISSSFAAAALLLAWISTPAAAQPASARGDREVISVMTFNLRYASERPPNSWPERRPVMRDCLREINPDIIGTQEGLYHQLRDMEKDLPEYAWIGTGRDGGSRGEFMAVFYRKDRFEALEYDHFWLSDTPEVIGSATWGHSNRRMVTWVRFLDLNTKKQFYLFNTHFDHQVQPAREKSALLVRERIQALKTNLPILLIGDFNARAGANKTFDILVNDGGFKDTWDTARERLGKAVATFHNFKGPVESDARIDWILSRGEVETVATEISTCHRDGQYPSDHFPVTAWVKLGQQ